MRGHPIHPALVHFPVGLLLSATIADLAWLAGLTHDTHVAAIMMAGGLAGGLLAMAAGMVDLVSLDQSVAPDAMRHMVVMSVAWVGYGLALYLRRDAFSGGATLATSSLAVSLVSAAVLSVGGWLGGRLVYTLGANVAERR